MDAMLAGISLFGKILAAIWDIDLFRVFLCLAAFGIAAALYLTMAHGLKGR